MVDYINDTPNAPKAVGPYSQGTRAAGLFFTSGQIGIDPTTGKFVGDTVEAQCAQVLKNLKALLEHQRLSFSDVAKTTIFLASMGDYKTVNGIYEQALGSAKPARSTVQVAGLPLGALVEIEMVAVSRS